MNASLPSLVLLTLVAASPVARAEASENMTPLILAVQDAPVPFMAQTGTYTWFTNWG